MNDLIKFDKILKPKSLFDNKNSLFGNQTNIFSKPANNTTNNEKEAD